MFYENEYKIIVNEEDCWIQTIRVVIDSLQLNLKFSFKKPPKNIAGKRGKVLKCIFEKGSGEK